MPSIRDQLHMLNRLGGWRGALEAVRQGFLFGRDDQRWATSDLCYDHSSVLEREVKQGCCCTVPNSSNSSNRTLSTQRLAHTYSLFLFLHLKPILQPPNVTTSIDLLPTTSHVLSASTAVQCHRFVTNRGIRSLTKY
jgi:hypothetical protein